MHHPGADPRILDKQGKTAMDYCIHYDSPESLVAILNAVPDGIHCRNSAGQTPLHATCDSAHPSTGCFKLLLSAKEVDVNAADTRLRTPLHACAHSNRIRIAQLLLDRGAQPSVCRWPRGVCDNGCVGVGVSLTQCVQIPVWGLESVRWCV